MRRWNTQLIRRGLALAVGIGLLAAAAAPAQDVPKAETILDRYIEVTGGKEAHLKLKNQVTHGKMEIGGANLKGPVTVYHAEPNKLLVLIEMQGIGKIEQGTDGKVVWEKSPLTGNRIITDEERTTFLRRADIHGDIHWRKLYKKAEVAGEEKINGKAAYKVVLTPADGPASTQYYDKDSGLLVKMSTTIKSPMGELASDSFVSDYKKVDGVLIPHKVRQSILVQEITIVLDKVEHNVKIPETRFAIPDDIKKLLDKK